ncbi:hypothetical protein ACWD11_31980 [Streptomyces sp. NPDC002776]
MVKVTQWAPCPGAVVEQDPWIPLDASWEVDRDRQPLYLMISGSSGGYLEVRVHPESGQLMSLTVIDLPPEGGGLDSIPDPELLGDVVPVFDISEWEDVDPAIRIVRKTVDLSHARLPEGELLTLGGAVTAVEASCGPVVVGVSHQSELTHFWFRSESTES